MELFRKGFIFCLMVYMQLQLRQVSALGQLTGLVVVPIRNEQHLKLHIWWNSTLPEDAAYSVTVDLIDSEQCTIKESLFLNQQHIKCVPIVIGVEATDVLIPSDTGGVVKHTCTIQQLCTYSILVEALSFASSIRETVVIPNCVDGLCSCHYAVHLPSLVDTTADVNVSSNLLRIRWKVGDYDPADLPIGVTPKFIFIRVRRGTNKDLEWGGQHSSMKELTLPFKSGSHTFNLDQLPGSMFIFLIQLKVIDTQSCERASEPIRVTIPDNDQKYNTSYHPKGKCTGASCDCDHMDDIPEFLFVSQHKQNEVIISWHALKNDSWQRISSSHNIELQLAIYEEASGTLLCAASVNPMTTNTYTFGLDDSTPHPSSGIQLTTMFVDSLGCESRLSTHKVYSHSSKPFVFSVVFSAILMVIIGIICWTLVYYKRRSKTRWKANNWREVYVRSSATDHHQQMHQMEENRLYIDMDILNARARGDADYLEIPHSCLRIGREIGKGAFGRVFMASAVKLPGFNGPKIVAIKQLKKCPSSDEFDEFLDEIAMMKKVGKHPNIVTLLGCCTIKEPLTMIMEYIGCGDLLEYLRKIRAKHLAKVNQLAMVSQLENVNTSQRSVGNNLFGPMVKYLDLLHTSSSNSDASYITQTDTTTRPSVTETTYTMLSGALGEEDTTSALGSRSLEYVLDHKELHNFAKQIACGMQHLEELQITHRDLAARNILIDERKMLKISDFGLSRTGIYVNTRNKKVPLRWLSIEAMRDNLYSNKSDVWAFGIVLWEIGTLGGYPYPSVSNHELFGYLQEGKRLERPENCTPEVYELMMQCWREDPNERPSFMQISKHLEPHKKIYIDFNDIEPTYVFPPTSDQLGLAIANNK
uniref:Uncharacterized protein n=1 Tax=Anopheles atroparvus TaxID=41427 RepID=A0A182JN47_ANOAO